MKWLKTVTVLAMLALWLPATNHCRLEQLPGLGFLVCCEHEETAPHQDDDCQTDGCAAVESGLYKTEDGPLELAAPPVVAAAFLLPVLTDQAAPAVISQVVLDSAPPELPTLWQFFHRATGLPRAPSSVS